MLFWSYGLNLIGQIQGGKSPIILSWSLFLHHTTSALGAADRYPSLFALRSPMVKTSLLDNRLICHEVGYMDSNILASNFRTNYETNVRFAFLEIQRD